MNLKKTALCFLMLLPFFVISQNLEQEVGAIIQDLSTIVSQTISKKIAQPSKNSLDSEAIIALSNIEVEQTYKIDNNFYYQAQQEALRKQTHLKYSVGFLQNFNPTQQDFEDNILYQRRLRNELSWDVLEGGYFETRERIKQLKLEESFYKETLKYAYDRTSFPSKMNHTIFLFKNKKNQLLRSREDILLKQQNLMERLYFLKKITKETILKLNTKIAEVNALKEIYGTYNEFKFDELDSSLLNNELGLFDVNYELFKKFQINDFDTLKSDMLEAIERQNNWFRQLGVKAFVRNSYYDLVTTNPGSRSFFSAGVGLSIPLSFNSKEKTRAESEKLNKRFEDLHNAKINKEIDILNETYEYRYHLKQYVMFYQKKLLLLERIRKENVKYQLNDVDFNPLSALEFIDQLYQVEIELLDIKQNLYIRLLKIHEKFMGAPMEDLIVPFTLPNFNDDEIRLYRTTYVWTNTIKNYSVEFLDEFIRYNRFDEVELAVGDEKDSIIQLKINLINRLTDKGIQVNLMFGQNNYLTSENYTETFKKILKQYPLSKIHGLHLDIEPHTMDEWDVSRGELKKSYLKMLDEANTISKDYLLKFSVDLPLFLDVEYVQKVAEKVDEIRFMCYENIDTNYVIRKISEAGLTPNKYSISVRTEDFKSRLDLENYANKIAETLNNFKINIHDLRRLIEFDHEAIKNEKH